LLLASLPPGFPRNPNVLLIRTHPNPFPSVGYKKSKRNLISSPFVKHKNAKFYFVSVHERKASEIPIGKTKEL
jgi:hypothetical protein